MAYGIPALLVEDSNILTITTVLGDILQFAALFFMWLAVVRVYAAKKPFLKGIMLTLVVMLFFISIYLSISTNLSNPVTITQGLDGNWAVNFSFSGIYAVVTAVQYTSFLLLAFFFGSQAKFSSNMNRKVRIYSISFILFAIGLIYVLQPALSSNLGFRTTTLLIAINIIVAGLLIAGTLLLSKKKKCFSQVYFWPHF